MSTTELLAAYDAQLRMEAEVADATEWHRHGPLVRARWGDSGFVSGRDLSGLTAGELEALVTDTLAWFRDETSVTEVEWKTRGHDRPDLVEVLVAHGFVADEEETVMVGRADLLDRPVELPDGVPLFVDGSASLGMIDLPETGWSAAAGHATSWGGPGSIGVLVVRRGTRWSNPFPGDPEPQDFGGALPDVAGSLAAAAGEETRSSGLSKLASMKCGISTS